MSKKLVSDQVAQAIGLTGAAADRAVTETFNALRTVLEKEQRVVIPGFGTFHRKLVDTRQRRNPRTGEPVTVAAHYKLSFKETKGGKG